jgi:hypothetical protein
MRLEYLRPGAAMMWTMPGARRTRQIRIVIEELPDGMWDWTVWESQRPATSKFGVRETAASALADAAVAAANFGLDGKAENEIAPGESRPDRVPTFANVEKTPQGPRLVVGGVCVHSWASTHHEPDADRMAAEINAVFFTASEDRTKP